MKRTGFARRGGVRGDRSLGAGRGETEIYLGLGGGAKALLGRGRVATDGRRAGEGARTSWNCTMNSLVYLMTSSEVRRLALDSEGACGGDGRGGQREAKRIESHGGRGGRARATEGPRSRGRART